VYVTGGSTGATSHQDYLTIAYNAATGARLWVERYNGPPNGDDAARSLAVSPSAGPVYVTGYSLGFNDPGSGLLRTSSRSPTTPPPAPRCG
jgi:hypothetical protein